MPEHPDTVFALPAVDDPPATEVGVILLGLDAERLLAGLGMAALAGPGADATQVTLMVDLARHGVTGTPSFGTAVAAGADRWHEVRPALAAAEPGSRRSAAPRQAWEQAHRLLAATGICDGGSATHAYLTACWLRRRELDEVRPPSGEAG